MIMRVVLAAFVTFRIARMLTLEDGPLGIFYRLRTELGKKAAVSKQYGVAWTAAELFNCPHCLGLWITFFLLPLILIPTVGGDAILVVFAVAGMQSFLQGRSSE